MKSNKSNPINSNQIQSNQIKSNQIQNQDSTDESATIKDEAVESDATIRDESSVVRSIPGYTSVRFPVNSTPATSERCEQLSDSSNVSDSWTAIEVPPDELDADAVHVSELEQSETAYDVVEEVVSTTNARRMELV